MMSQIRLGDIPVDVLFKDIKNVHLSVHPPTGRVRISAPSRMRLETVRVFAISKLDWIKRQQARLQGQEREPAREFLNRESHYVWGRRYLLHVIESDSVPSIELKHTRLVLRLRSQSDRAKRQATLDEWYREQLRKAVPPLIARWEPIIGARVERLFVQRMKTKWGSCNARSRSIRVNTDLAKKPPEFLEYVVVHEMAHLIARRHDDRFAQIMDQCLPNWRFLRQRLNETPLSHVEWSS